MMTKDKDDEITGKQLYGCFSCLWSLCVTIPMWVVLLYMILLGLGESIPAWTWMLYWSYVPAMFIGCLLMGILKAVVDGKKV